ncbi:protein ripply2 isoform X2 [Rousettus aegyptiacus]|uniref:protein ripply2 isoform X2 n=1 Tax=Rousettus aegyptiacus TaxID=9407 RepID=UPI00168CB20D|nr:protein ripply2 isoform X2 [Rousettus aegyptiacus]
MRLARQRGAERNRTSQHASSRGGYISSGFGPGGWKGQDLQESWQPRYAASRCTMETAVRLESGAGECAHCHRLLPAAPDGQSPRAGANSGSGGFWRPWVDARGEQEEEEEEASHYTAEASNSDARIGPRTRLLRAGGHLSLRARGRLGHARFQFLEGE